jgi:hypothetical protein
MTDPTDPPQKNPYSVSPASMEGGNRDGTDASQDSSGPGGEPDSGPFRYAPLFSPAQIFVGSFIGGPIAAGWIMARNYQMLNRPERARQSAWLGVLFTVLVLMVAFMLPESATRSVWPILYNVLIYFYAAGQFGEITRKHYARGGVKPSWWRPVGIGVASIAIIMVATMVFAILFPSLFNVPR